jgi:hypothetical protein
MLSGTTRLVPPHYVRLLRSPRTSEIRLQRLHRLDLFELIHRELLQTFPGDNPLLRWPLTTEHASAYIHAALFRALKPNRRKVLSAPL